MKATNPDTFIYSTGEYSLEILNHFAYNFDCTKYVQEI